MLGLIKSNPSRSWMWAAYGKHPAIKDYFRVGRDFPLARVFAGWVENGYKQLAGKGGPILYNSWQFWARGATGESIVCGFVRDSSDSIGRHYPLLIIGTGSLREWETNWVLLPLACEAAWRDMEYISILGFNDLKQMETEILNIQHPQPRWAEYQSKKASFQTGSGLFECNFIPSDQKDSFIPLDLSSALDQNLYFSSCCSSYLNGFKIVPSIVFMGEIQGRYFMKFHSRPLTPADFSHLWAIGNGGQGA